MLGINCEEKSRDVVKRFHSAIIIIVPKSGVNGTYKLLENLLIPPFGNVLRRECNRCTFKLDF